MISDEIKDIGTLVLFLSVPGMQSILDDDIWKMYGYANRPKKGIMIYKLFSHHFALEKFIAKELTMMGLIDVLSSIKKANINTEYKLLVSAMVIDMFLETVGHEFESPSSFVRYLIRCYEDYIQCDGNSIHHPILIKAKEELNKKDFAKFLVGTSRLFMNQRVNFLLDINSLIKMIEHFDFSDVNTEDFSAIKHLTNPDIKLVSIKVLN